MGESLGVPASVQGVKPSSLICLILEGLDLFIKSPSMPQTHSPARAWRRPSICGIYKVLCFCDQNNQMLVIQMLEIEASTQENGSLIVYWAQTISVYLQDMKTAEFCLPYSSLCPQPHNLQCGSWCRWLLKSPLPPGLNNTEVLEYNSQSYIMRALWLLP